MKFLFKKFFHIDKHSSILNKQFPFFNANKNYYFRSFFYFIFSTSLVFMTNNSCCQKYYFIIYFTNAGGLNTRIHLEHKYSIVWNINTHCIQVAMRRAMIVEYLKKKSIYLKSSFSNLKMVSVYHDSKENPPKYFLYIVDQSTIPHSSKNGFLIRGML